MGFYKIQNKYQASSVLTLTDENFCKRVGVPLKEYEEFKERYFKEKAA